MSNYIRFQKLFDQQVKQDDVFEHVAQGVVDKYDTDYAIVNCTVAVLILY